MSTNDIYLGHKSVEETAHKLVYICNACPLNKPSNKDLQHTYTSPQFIDTLERPLTIDDIPMVSNSVQDTKPVNDESGKIPWEDSIKNFIFDITSVTTSRKFATCILLSGLNYAYQDASIHVIGGKYGLENVTLIDVTPCEPEEGTSVDEFKLRVRHKSILYESIISSQTLTSDIVQWYTPASTLVFCHDNSIAEYQNTLSMMPNSVWSISCTYTNYIINDDPNKKCSYICSVFSFPGSTETRAVSTGLAKFTNSKVPAKYRGKLNYYSRSIRFSRHSSGRCYDCQKLLTTVQSIYKSPLSTPIISSFAKFSPSFIKSINKINLIT